jgi:hypothetical protein
VPEPTHLALPVSALQEVAIQATGGEFTLSFEGEKTKPIAFDAAASVVQSELNSLASIGGVGASVTVTGGPGDARGSNPYAVRFGGTLADRRVSELVAASVTEEEAPGETLAGNPAEAVVTVIRHGGSEDEYMVIATDTGGVATSGPVTITDALGPGVSLDATGVSGFESLTRAEMSCESTPAIACTYSEPIPPGDALVMLVHVDVPPGSPQSTATNVATVSGGGLAEGEAHEETQIGGEVASFGLPQGSPQVTLSTSQAGAHPDVTTSVMFASELNPRGPLSFPYLPVQSPKDVQVPLPAGLLGNPTTVGRCLPTQLGLGALIELGGCPVDSQVGIVYLNFGINYLPVAFPVYNMAPQPGEPAELGFYALVAPVYLPVRVRSESDYGLTASLTNIIQSPLPILGSVLTLWGVPAEHSHDAARHIPGTFEFGAAAGVPAEAFMRNPTSCQASLTSTITADSWQEPEPSPVPSGVATLGEIGGCEQLAFHPSIAVRPDTAQAGAPAGYTVEVALPQSNDPLALATPDLRDATVALPEGTVVSPGGADGLQSCSDNPASPRGDQFKLHSTAPASCPEAAQIGTVEIHVPALASPLEGQVFLGDPNCAPCSPTDAQSGNMLRLFLQAQGSGVTVKLEGRAHIDQSTGRLTATFAETPQQAFSDLKLTLKGGARAPLANPSGCGPATTTADLTPWSAPATPDATPQSTFTVAGCHARRFAPSLVAGTTNNQAGAHSPFTLTLSREDADQPLRGIAINTPPGLLGTLASVPLCPEPLAANGACGQQSLIGHVTVGAGPGPQPLYLGGSVYLTGPYGGAPFGLSVVVPAVAGPFNLGQVVVRAAIFVDPHTATLSVLSSPLPQTLDGIPLGLKVINITIDRPGFIFNPTDCEPLSLTGTLTSTGGLSASASTPFRAANCATLAFKPRFTTSTRAHTSRSGGASLDVKIVYPPGAEANIHAVRVSLPMRLPARLTTIQQACQSTVFAANPANCPPGSNVGVGRAETPVLSVPLVGPAYLVAHGGAAFPDLVIVLQGEGVVFDLTGSIFISKHGVTSSTFGSVPDVPIESFELTLPQGPHSALAVTLPAKARGSLCSSKLTMPTTIDAQNGARIVQSTKISVLGCPRHRAGHRPTRRRRRAKH